MIACVVIPYFAAAVERRDDPDLDDQPLILSQAGQVYAVSAQAELVGARPGMPVMRALGRCPQGTLRPARPNVYAEAAQSVLEVLADLSPHADMAQRGPHRLFLLGVGTKRGSGLLMLTQQAMGLVRRESGMEPAIGVAATRYAAEIAGLMADPGEAIAVADGHERAFLAPLPIEALPLDEKALHWLRLLGLTTVGRFAAIDRAAIHGQLGQPGARAHELAQGRDGRTVRRYEPPTVFEVERHLADPLGARPALEALLGQVAATLAAQLWAQSLAARELAVAWHLEDGQVIRNSQRLIHATANERELATALARLLERAELQEAVTGLMVRLGALEPLVGKQLDLFVHGDQQRERLRQTLTDLASRYGSHFYRVDLVSPGAHLLEARFRTEKEGAPNETGAPNQTGAP